jgi:hypothetical protein
MILAPNICAKFIDHPVEPVKDGFKCAVHFGRIFHMVDVEKDKPITALQIQLVTHEVALLNEFVICAVHFIMSFQEETVE